MKRIILFFFAILLFDNTNAQDNEILAKSSYLNAESSYNNNKIREAWDYTEQCIKYLGQTSLSIQYLRVKICLSGASTNSGWWKFADKELKSFFALKKVPTFPDEKYNEMVEAIAFVKNNLQKENEKIKQEKKGFKSCLSNNTLKEYNNYLKNYGSIDKEHSETVNKLIELTKKIESAANGNGNIALSLFERSKLLCTNNEYLQGNIDAQATVGICIEVQCKYNSRKIRNKLNPIFLNVKYWGDYCTVLRDNISFIREDKDLLDLFLDTTNSTFIAESLKQLAYSEFLLGNYKTADIYYSLMLLRDAGNIDALEVKAKIKYNQKDYYGAVEFLSKVLNSINSKAKYSYIYSGIADCKMRLNDFSGTEDAYSNYIKNAPAEYVDNGYYMRGVVRVKQNKFVQAIDDFTQAIKTYPRDGSFQRGKVYLLHLKDTTKANADFRNVLKNSNTSNIAAYGYFYLGNHEKALDIVKNILDDVDKDDESAVRSIYYDYACILSLMNKKTEALDKLKIAFDNGYYDFWWAANDEDFLNIKNMPAFNEIIETAQKKYLEKIGVKETRNLAVVKENNTESKEITNSVKVPEMIYVEGGTFTMGNSSDVKDQRPAHNVTLSSFSIGKYEITVEEYRAFCTSTNYKMPETPDWGWVGNHPISGVSWNDAVAYCNWLSESTGKKFRLPTEAEWEFAARGGKNSQGYKLYSGTNDWKEAGWFMKNSDKQCKPVGLKKANELDIYDITGNVFEWCNDFFDEKYYSRSPLSNPQGPSAGALRVFRGGGWNNSISTGLGTYYYNFLTMRGRVKPETVYSDLGFRIVLTD